MNTNVIVGGMTATPTLEVTGNVGIHPNSPTGSVAFYLTTMAGGTRQGVKVTSVCPTSGCLASGDAWPVTLSAPNTHASDDGFTYAEQGPTKYKALLGAHGPIFPGSYTVKIETLWIY
ncbi:Uncharacterised protein [Serratia liquefaciens]|nr:Uncharacterised protein [Serratia quinivorans]CAI1085722.1 Uncharacterised protein [Serratia quinivorans]CAI2122480.1 Uncharacterised protein [Serratia quinivorans]CAI2489561.1 Uncharacterised protein [Serratia liquefaciens]